VILVTMKRALVTRTLRKFIATINGLVENQLADDVKESEMEFAMGKGRKLRSLKDLRCTTKKILWLRGKLEFDFLQVCRSIGILRVGGVCGVQKQPNRVVRAV